MLILSQVGAGQEWSFFFFRIFKPDPIKRFTFSKKLISLYYYQPLTLGLQCSLCGRGYNGCSKDSNAGPSHLNQSEL